MALQMTPLMVLALKYGSAAAAGFAVARVVPRGRLAKAVEREMESTPRGLRLLTSRGQLSGTARIIKDFSVGRLGPKLRVDGTALARIKVRFVT